MPGTSEFGEIAYTLTDLIVAYYDKINDLYGTPSAMAVGQQLVVDPQSDTDELRSFGVIGELLSVPTHAKLTLDAGGVDFSAFAAITGDNTVTSGSSPNQRRTQDRAAGGQGLPYFGVIGVGATTGGGVAIVGLRCCMLDKKPKYVLDGKANKFNMSSAEGKAIPLAGKLERLRQYQTASDWTAPATGSDFKNFFS